MLLLAEVGLNQAGAVGPRTGSARLDDEASFRSLVRKNGIQARYVGTAATRRCLKG